MVIRRQGRYELTLSFSHTGIHRYRTLVVIWCKSTGKSLSKLHLPWWKRLENHQEGGYGGNGVRGNEWV